MQRYLKQSKTTGPDPEFQYEWGVNTHSELTTAKVNAYINQALPRSLLPTAQIATRCDVFLA